MVSLSVTIETILFPYKFFQMQSDTTERQKIMELPRPLFIYTKISYVIENNLFLFCINITSGTTLSFKKKLEKK